MAWQEYSDFLTDKGVAQADACTEKPIFNSAGEGEFLNSLEHEWVLPGAAFQRLQREVQRGCIAVLGDNIGPFIGQGEPQLLFRHISRREVSETQLEVQKSMKGKYEVLSSVPSIMSPLQKKNP